MTNESEPTGNGQNHDRSRMQELIRSLAYHATTEALFKYLHEGLKAGLPHSRAIRHLRLSKEQASLYAAEWKAIRRFGFPDGADHHSGFGKLLGWPALVQWEDLFCFEHGNDDALLLCKSTMMAMAKTPKTGVREALCISSWRNGLCRSRNFAACEFEIQFT
jgi:hypothetical protein